MKIVLLQIGKTTNKNIIDLSSEYCNRIQHYINFEQITIPDIKYTKNIDTKSIKEKEGLSILQKIQQGDYIILLDEKGKQYSSKDFSNLLQKKINSNIKRLVFIIGGAYGFSDEIYKKKNEMLSLSLMTFNHQMVRAFFTEQLYRAFTILNGEPYHHE